MVAGMVQNRVLTSAANNDTVLIMKSTGERARGIMRQAATIKTGRQLRMVRGKLDGLTRGLSVELRDSILRTFDRHTPKLERY